MFDWIGIRAVEHTLQPGQTISLKGYGREAVGYDVPIQYDDIDSPAITHRYDLVKADPAKPYLPTTDPDGNYIPLDPSVGTVDQQNKMSWAEARQLVRERIIPLLFDAKS